jgi:DDE superfamily endonuclease
MCRVSARLTCLDLLHARISFYNGLNIGEYWIAGDTAYLCDNYLLTPFTKAQTHDQELGIRRDAFNFFLSSLRMHVEQNVGIMVARFGILWRSLRFQLPEVPRILSAFMRIHNLCIDQKVPPITAAIDVATKSATKEAFVACWNNAEEPRDQDSQQGRRNDLWSIK